MILEIANNLYRQLSDELAMIEQEEITDKLEIAKKLLTARSYLVELKNRTVNYTFSSEQEEIAFFKTKKPTFISQVLYYSARQRIELTKPEGTADQLKKYYRYLLKGIEKFYRDNRELHSYHRSGADHLDRLLFMRSSTEPPSWLCPVRIDYD